MSEVSTADALHFLADNPHVYLLARRADGYPTGYPMMCLVADGVVCFSTYRASAKVTNLLRDGFGSVLAISRIAHDKRVLLARGSVEVDDEIGRNSSHQPNNSTKPERTTYQVKSATWWRHAMTGASVACFG